VNALEKYAARQVLIEKLAIIAGAMRLGKKVRSALSTPVGELADVVTRPGRTLKKVFPRTSRQISDVLERAGPRHNPDSLPTIHGGRTWPVEKALHRASQSDSALIPRWLRGAAHDAGTGIGDLRYLGKHVQERTGLARKRFPRAMKALAKADNARQYARIGRANAADSRFKFLGNHAAGTLGDNVAFQTGLVGQRALNAIKKARQGWRT
jgi:hypothetical protein